MKKAKKADGRRHRGEAPDPAALVRAARQLVDHDDETPLTEEERAIMGEIRREYPRPSRDEIRKEAKRLLK